jgi:hypothetical protein
MTAASLREAIRATARDLLEAAAERDRRLAGATITAIGWGTVELDRAERDLAAGLELASGVSRWKPATRDAALGATARLGPAIDGGLPLVLLEPDTEGRLAAILARHGEGVVAVYVRTSARADLVIVPAAIGATSAPGGQSPTVLAARPPSAPG